MVSKIATCCYCGARAALVLTGKGRHELACSNCGAPLHQMKSLRADHASHATRELVKPSKVRKVHKPAKVETPKKKKKARPQKKRKSFFSKAFEEAFDVIEDIFD